MDITREEAHFLSLLRQCSPMQRMLITDALQELLALPGEVNMFDDYAHEEMPCAFPDGESATDKERMGKILEFPKR